MRLLDKILVGNDFTSASENALRMAVALAQRFGSHLTLLHVIPGSEEELPISLAKAKEASIARMSELKKGFETEKFRIEELVVTNGIPFEEIIRVGHDTDVNLIVVGSKDKADDETGRLGTTAERLVRRATKPVWVVKKNTVPEVTKILCPVDYSAASSRALKNAIHLARSFRSKLIILTVIRPLSRFLIYGLTEREKSQHAAQQELNFETFLKGFNLQNLEWQKLIREGKPDTEILKCAKKTHSDLIVMGSVGKTGLTKILLGSVAAKVTRQLPCSIVTVKAEDAIRLRYESNLADIEACFCQGKELLAGGFSEEAFRHFERCVSIDPLFAPGWERLAEVHAHLGRTSESGRCKEHAKHIRQRLWETQVEAEIRSRRRQ